MPVTPEEPSRRDYAVTARLGVGSTGRRIQLCTNHFNVSVGQPDVVFYQYTVRFVLSLFCYQWMCVYEMCDKPMPFFCRLVSPQKTVRMSKGKELAGNLLTNFTRLTLLILMVKGWPSMERRLCIPLVLCHRTTLTFKSSWKLLFPNGIVLTSYLALFLVYKVDLIDRQPC